MQDTLSPATVPSLAEAKTALTKLATTDALVRLFWIPGRLPSAARRLGMGMVQRSGWLKRFFMDEARGMRGDLPALLRA